jgi:hypothetical protein
MSWGENLTIEELCDMLERSQMACDELALAIVQKRAAENAAKPQPAGLE